jgi:hypothetical protein
MKIDIKPELKSWIIYFVTIIVSVYVHELGHSAYAWFHGYKAVPTPAKSYIPDDFPPHLYLYFSLSGIIASLLFVVAAFLFYNTSNNKFNSAILAAAIVAPGMYTIRFLLKGRGHDATEFQEAQSALGLHYEGHTLDWLFLLLFLSGIIMWLIKSKPAFKILGKLLIGTVLTFIFFIALQDLNNFVFDPLFKS